MSNIKDNKKNLDEKKNLKKEELESINAGTGNNIVIPPSPGSIQWGTDTVEKGVPPEVDPNPQIVKYKK
ncbi:hypothetical protein [Francisella salimarina]|uniref:hypothetical protein n=1 Tax=Francisella salimarina TaxID=2599927 RepID=UPI003750B895